MADSTMIIKSVTENRQSVTVVADDSELLLALNANTPYRAEAICYMQSPATPDLKMRFSYSGTLLYGVGIDFVQDPQVAIATAVSMAGNVITMPVAQMISGNTKFIGGTGTSTNRSGPLLWCYFWTNSSGTFSYQWAQNTSTAVNTQCIITSVLVITDLTAEL